MPARTRVHRLLPPLPAGGVADTVASRLADAIQLGLLETGQQLPSESTLASQLGVSTVTLREALATLRLQGLVETRRGRHGGSFVCEPSAASASRMRIRLGEMPVIALRDAGDEWAAVAGTAARLAAARSSTDQVARLRQFAERLAGASTIGDRTRAHSRFFIEIALASQSERLTRSEVRLQAELGELLWIPTRQALDPSAVSATLLALASAIEAEQAGEARAFAEGHVQTAIRWLIATRLDMTDRPAL